ncbi:GNAT family N-acetyltransferase [Pseudovibrio ascidiaceicola]|uniref:GNAT family N-acetyltransferase n=1 Tax=Pseudovibrio ascidiaceicola TaxID=285279 RepID=UPI003D36E41A
MILFRRASEFSLSQLHQVMVLAFSDYVIQMDMPLADFERMIRARGFDAELSWVATDNEQLVGFWFIGKQDAYPGTIYAVSTGTAPKARGKGIASKLFAKVEEYAAQQGYHHVQLEVITSNTAAVKAYEKLGFQTKRNFQCFSLHKAAFTDRNSERMPVPADWAEIEPKAAGLWERAPSWQNTAFAIRALADGVTAYKIEQNGQLAGYIAFTRKTGAVMQIAVAPDKRRQGYATALLTAAFANMNKEALTFINLDEGDETIMQALSKLGATKTLQQYEMHRALQTSTAHGQESVLTTP